MNKLTTKYLSILTTLCLSFISTSAYADNTYYSLSFSSIKYDTGAVPVSGTILVDESSFGYKFKVGNMISRDFAMEIFYADYGEASIQGNSGDQFRVDNTLYAFTVNNASLTLDNEAFGVNAVYFKPLNNSLTFMARLGILAWSSDFIVSDGASSSSIGDTGKDIFYSLGLEQEFSDSTSIILEYEQLKFDDVDVDSLSFALALKF
jgi:Outer membrane protein beta-barrel domain